MSTNRTRVTLKDVASQCGYSINTVSRALRGDAHLAEETVQKIQATADEIGYIRNSLASSLRSGKTNIIAIIIEELQNQHYSYLLDRLSLQLDLNGYRVMILTNRIDTEKTHSLEEPSPAVSYAISHSVDGVIFFPNLDNGVSAQSLIKNHIPLVFIDREIDGIKADVIRMDDYAGGQLAAKLLLEKGHRKLLYMAGPLINGSQTLREKGFFDVLCQAGIRREEVKILPHDQVMTAISQDRLDSLLFPATYTGVFAFNDQIGYYLLNRLSANGYKVPEQISVIGFDNIRRRFPYLAPLSTISVLPDQHMAKDAVRLLLERIERPNKRYESIIVPVQYYEGGTLANPEGAEGMD